MIKIKYFNPTAELKELDLLQYIEKNSESSQKAMAEEINSAVSMVNVYLNRLEEENYIIKNYQSKKVVHYHITEEGMKRKNYLAITYFRELLDLYNVAENNIENFFQHLEEKAYQNILFYGAGDVAETILKVYKKRKKQKPKILAIVDDQKKSKKENFHGLKVIGREDIKNYPHDGIIITSYTFEEEIKERLEEIDYPSEQIKLFFSEM